MTVSDRLNSNQLSQFFTCPSVMETPDIHLINCLSAHSNFNPTSDMLDELGWPPLSQETEGSTNSVLQNY